MDRKSFLEYSNIRYTSKGSKNPSSFGWSLNFYVLEIYTVGKEIPEVSSPSK